MKLRRWPETSLPQNIVILLGIFVLVGGFATLWSISQNTSVSAAFTASANSDTN